MHALPLLALIAQSPPANLDGYAHPRFDDAISYPSALLTILPEANNSYGVRFKPVSGSGEFAVSGSFKTIDFTLEQRRAEQQCAGGKQIFRSVEPTVWVVSCETSKGSIFYSKELLLEGAQDPFHRKPVRLRDSTARFRATYPFNDKSKWDPVVAGMADSLSLYIPTE